MKQPELGGYIASLRKEQGLTQEELVELCNINVRTIQRIEAGDVTPRNYTIKNILQALGSSYAEITQELHIKPKIEKAPENLLKNPKNGLVTGILGILYIIISIPLTFADLYASIAGDQIFNIYVYATIAVLYIMVLSSFYICVATSIKTNSNLLKSCIFIFLGLETLSTVMGYYWYVAGYNTFGSEGFALVIGFNIIYSISLIILAVPFYYSRHQFTGIFKSMGLILAIAAGCHFTLILFPFGILGTLLFEILLIALMFKFYQDGKDIIE